MKEEGGGNLPRDFGETLDEVLLCFPGTNGGDCGVQALQLLGGLGIVLVEDARVDVHAGIIAQQLLLFGGAFVGGGLQGGAKTLAEGFGELFPQMLLQRLGNVVLLLLLLFRGQLPGLGFDLRRLRAIVVRVK